MKNLKLLNRKVLNINNKIQSSCPSNDYNDGIYFITSNSIIFSNGCEIQNVISDDFKNFFKIQNGLSLYCATKNNITSYDNYNGMQLDILEFSDEIIEISLSPDQSILMILTNDMQFTIVSNELQILTSFSLEQAGFGTAEPLSIGWGKKETQFHGKVGKEARNIVEHVEKYSEFDSKSSFIVWKDDGEYFAVSWISYSKIQNKSEAHTRMIRIFSKDGELFSTFEPTNVLENGLFWRTKSNLIVASCRNSKGLEIVFFEQNGLRHGGFQLYEAGFSDDKIVSAISFNSNDDICAVVIQDIKKNVTSVKLFATNNYYWYQKKVINIDNLEHLSIHWSLDRLHLCSENGNHYVYQLYFEIDRSIVDENKSESNLSKLPNLISVIDGDKILMTPFEYCVIPPPYCAFTMNFTENVSFVSLPIIDEMTTDNLSCFVQLSDYVCNWLSLTRKSVTEPKDQIIETQLKFGRSNCVYTPIISAVLRLEHPINSICWINNSSFYCVMNNHIYLYELENSQISINKLPIEEDIIVGKVCYKSSLYIQDISGQVYQYENNNIKPLFKYSSFCSEMFAVKLKSESNDTVIALSTRFNQLYINSLLQPGTYLSILPLSHHLICTNINQKLRCLNLNENNLNDLINLLDEKNYKCDFDFDETVRLIEPGTEIITCVPSDSKIILMMPRGNLETIYPRALVLDDLKKLMDKCLFSEAIEKMRRQRVNLNLLYDHNPKIFMENLEKLVRSNSKNDRLVLLISELSIEDVTETMYKRFYHKSTKEKTKSGHEKVNNVCSAVAKMLENDINDEYINLILTCYVKMTPTASDKALQLLRQFKDNGKQKIWDKGLKYLQYLISIDDLYRVALSTYDLNLTLQVAQKTQLDPKEYVSFINGLNELPCENYRRFKINIFLKKPSIALEFIVKVADLFWDEAVELITANNLYIKALELFSRGSNHYNIISSLFAEYLISKSNDLKAAGMVYLRTNDKALCKTATNCFFRTLHWKEWVVASKKAEMNEDEIKMNLVNISARLKDVGRFSEALFINEVYLKDLNNAFNISLEGRLFTDAFRIMESLSGSSEDLTTRIYESINNTYQSFMLQLEESDRKYAQNLERLVEVRLNFIKTYKDLKFTGEDETLPDYMSDTISEVTSNSSRSSMNSKMSNSSQSSSKFKLKKKKVKNPWSDKKGSQKEEVGLIENLYLNIKHTQTMMSDVGSLIEMLCFIGSIDQSRSLMKACNKLLQAHSESINIIWDEFLIDRNYNSNDYEVQISNHIKVNRSDQYAGRRRYLLDEEFLKGSPQMNISMVSNIIGGF